MSHVVKRAVPLSYYDCSIKTARTLGEAVSFFHLRQSRASWKRRSRLASGSVDVAAIGWSRDYFLPNLIDSLLRLESYIV